MEKNQNHQRCLQIINKISKNFNVNSKIIKIKPYGNGLINKTFLITTNDNQKYILQQISDNLGETEKLMQNIDNVTKHLLSKGQKTLKLIKTKTNKNFLKIKNKNYRLFEYIDGKIYETINNPEDFKKAGIAFAKFNKALQDFDVNKIHITMPDFHNTAKRYENLMFAIKNGNQQRLAKSKQQIDYLISKNVYISDIQKLIDMGLKPTIIHGDTKINNVIFDKDNTYVIDFDTIMTSFLCYDYGDAIRSGCNTAKESQPANMVRFNLNNYIAFTTGYLSVFDNLSEIELQSLLIAPMLVTYELSLRFLTDYLLNDVYFSVQNTDDNLSRCKNQIALLEEMEKYKSFMKQILFHKNCFEEKNRNTVSTEYHK